MNDQEYRDVLGLVSGLGDEETDRRARDLIRTNPAAVSYVREVEQLAAMIQSTRPHAGAGPSPITAGELADQIAARVVLPRESLTSRRTLLFRLAPVGVAAALAALLVPAGIYVYRRSNAVKAVHVFIKVTVSADPLKGMYTDSIRLPARIRPEPDERTVITIPKTALVVVNTQAELDIQSFSEVDIKRGLVFVRASRSMRVQTPLGLVELEPGDFEFHVHELISIAAHKGAAVLQRSEGPVRITSGQCILYQSGRPLQIVVDTYPPTWAEYAIIESKRQ